MIIKVHRDVAATVHQPDGAVVCHVLLDQASSRLWPHERVAFFHARFASDGRWEIGERTADPGWAR